MEEHVAGSLSNTEQEERDLLAIAPSRQTAIAGGVVLGVGIFTTLLGVQTQSAWQMRGLALIATILLFVLGPVAVVLGWNLRKARGWAAFWACALMGGTSLLIALWSLYALLNGFLSLLSFALIPGNAVAAFLSWTRLEQTRSADAARERLAAQGLDSGL
jgi:hypothetical protein